jgi:adenylylsulfate kinase
MSRSCIWITGMPASGKSTLAIALTRLLTQFGHVRHIESDALRASICSGLSYSEQDRTRFYRYLVNEGSNALQQGNRVVIDATGNLRKFRQWAAEAATPYLEVYVYCSIQVREARDQKGLYKACREGLKVNLPIFPIGDVAKPICVCHDEDRDYMRRNYTSTGIYEVPIDPDFVYDGQLGSADEMAEMICSRMLDIEKAI